MSRAGDRMSTLDAYAKTKLAVAERSLQRRTLVSTGRLDGPRMWRDGRELISFCCNDYLGLAQHPALRHAASVAIAEHGVGSGASRLVTGNHPLYPELEARLASLKGTEDACVFGSGYLANVGLIPALVGDSDLVLYDSLSHASTHAGVALSRARAHAFTHNDMDNLRRALAELRGAHRHCLLLTEGVFSMDGDRAPLDHLAAIASEFDAWLMVDDAHGIGVLGRGRGSAFDYDPRPRIDIHMGTLSKAVGAYGGFLAASRAVVDLVRTRARSLIYSTGLPPPVVAAAIAGLDIMIAEPERVATVLAKARRFTVGLGLPAAESAIVPIVLGASETALAASAALAERGFLVTAIRPPTVPHGTARLRVTFSAAHDDRDIDRLVDAIAALGLVRPLSR
jgi:8-amino-7-oxononanoate synthase